MKILYRIGLLSFLLIFLFNGNILSQKDSRLLHFPDINNQQIVFVYAGDIWSVSADGGDAKRLTSHKGMELFPKISPNGEWIAFSAEYSGSRQVYVMPSTGGTPQQLTYYNDVGEMAPRGGWDNVILDWTPDRKNIMIRGNRTPFGERNGKYYLVSIEGGFEKPLQITDGGFGVLSPDASKIAYTPISREFRTWKRYKGGRASDDWIYDLNKDVSEKITDFVGTDQIPVWHKNKIYFASDRDLTLNIFSYDLETKETKKVTNHTEFDVMWPSGENGMIAYENGGHIYKLNAETGKTEKVTVNISFDNPNILPYFKNVKDNIESASISPGGKRALFDARGDIFS
ncbi:MAG: PD40 domain-containing protein, partial [Bacteroidales bacterium]|nr:PD40 domain-containing protein [Bacteroidales bacterium]